MTSDLHAALNGLGDATEDLETGGFAGAICRAECRIDVLERPEFLNLVPLNDLPTGEHAAGLAGEVFGIAGQYVTQGGVVPVA